MDRDSLRAAMALFDLSDAFTREMLDRRYHALRAKWTPHRYANLTNSPQKYMHMYKKAEAKMKEIEAAYRTLSTWLDAQAPASLGPARQDVRPLSVDSDTSLQPPPMSRESRTPTDDHGAE